MDQEKAKIKGIMKGWREEMKMTKKKKWKEYSGNDEDTNIVNIAKQREKLKSNETL